VHGTTHERPIARFERERVHLIPLAGQPGFKLGTAVSRIVAEDWLVNFEANRYSVPFNLVGHTVQVQRQGEEVHIFAGSNLVARHRLIEAKHQVAILPEHSPGAIARNARTRRWAARTPSSRAGLPPEVEIRDLAIYERLLAQPATEEAAQ
jgi:hypothetical protein